MTKVYEAWHQNWLRLFEKCFDVKVCFLKKKSSVIKYNVYHAVEEMNTPP